MLNIHFIAGLPRSGSTLLAALLRQNPTLCAGITSPVANMIMATQQVMSAKTEYNTQISDHKREAVLRSLVSGYYADVEASTVVFDTNRAWCGKIDLVVRLFPQSRIICCVRPLAWILDSFERNFRSNPLQLSRLYSFEPWSTVYSRVDTLNNPSAGPVASSYHALREACFGEHAAKLILVTYESLARDPAQTMANLYEQLSLAHYTHDFENVTYQADQFDQYIGTPGLHTVGRKVQLAERRTILPPDIFQRFASTAFWLDPAFTDTHKVAVL